MKKIWTMMLVCTVILSACKKTETAGIYIAPTPPNSADQWSVITGGATTPQWLHNFDVASNPNVLLRLSTKFPTDTTLTDFNIVVLDNYSDTLGALAKANIVPIPGDSLEFAVHIAPAPSQIAPSQTPQPILDALATLMANPAQTNLVNNNEILFPDSITRIVAGDTIRLKINQISVILGATYSVPPMATPFTFGGVRLPVITLLNTQGQIIGFANSAN